MYAPGEELLFACFRLQCNSTSNWEFKNITSNCTECYISNDPHFFTFDGLYYDFHGRCNYTISQPICCDDSYNVSYGIYGQFDACWYSNAVSCLLNTTYKVDKFTSVLITHNDWINTVNIEINNNIITTPGSPGVPSPDCTSWYPVVLWKDGDCVRIVGEDYSIQACPSFMFIYTNNFHMNKIAGLCGYFTGPNNTADDFLMRPCGPISPTEFPFAVSWKTNSYPANCVDEYDPNQGGPNGRKKRQTNEPHCDNQYFNLYCINRIQEEISKCGYPKNEHVTEFAIENCIKDCCAEPQFCDHWVNVSGSFICEVGKNSKMEQNSEEVILDYKI